MQRIHRDVPIKPLPMQLPKQPQQSAQPIDVVPDNSSSKRNIIENLLFNLFGENDR